MFTKAEKISRNRASAEEVQRRIDALVAAMSEGKADHGE